MGQIINVDFRAGKVMIGRDEWLAGAARCETEAARQTDKIAATLRRCARSYRQRAEERGG